MLQSTITFMVGLLHDVLYSVSLQLIALGSSGVMSQNIWGGTIIARERSDHARGSVATERGEGVGGGYPR